MSKRKALGKGLRSLIPEAPPPRSGRSGRPPVSDGASAATEKARNVGEIADAAAVVAGAPASRTGVREIDIDRIGPNPRQPRKEFDRVALEELAHSLREEGLLQPVVVRPVPGDRFELVAGERRWRAAQIAGLMRMPALVRRVEDDRLLELALIENIQREELNPIETAKAFQTLMDDLGLTQQEIADRLGKPRSTVANALRLLNLAREVQQRIVDGSLQVGHAKVLAGITQRKLQCELADEIAGKGLSVRMAEQLVARRLRELEETEAGRPAAGRGPRPADPNVDAAERALASRVGTQVRIVQRGERGRIELHFFSHEEMERVYQLLMRAGQKG